MARTRCFFVYFDFIKKLLVLFKGDICQFRWLNTIHDHSKGDIRACRDGRVIVYWNEKTIISRAADFTWPVFLWWNFLIPGYAKTPVCYIRRRCIWNSYIIRGILHGCIGPGISKAYRNIAAIAKAPIIITCVKCSRSVDSRCWSGSCFVINWSIILLIL